MHGYLNTLEGNKRAYMNIIMHAILWKYFGLKMLPSSHSTATWCIMVSVYLPLPIRSGMLDVTIGMIKKVIHFNGKTLSCYNMYTQIFHKHINKSTLYELITKKS